MSASLDPVAQVLVGRAVRPRPSSRSVLAEALLRYGTSTAPAYTPTEAIARALTGAIAGWQGRLADEEERQREDEMLARIQQHQTAERERARQEMRDFLATFGLAPPTPSGAPAASPPTVLPPSPQAGRGVVTEEPLPPPEADRRAVNAEIAAERERILSDTTLTPEEQARRLADLSARHAARSGVPPIAGGYRANPGEGGAFAGLAPPSGSVPAFVPGAGVPAPPPPVPSAGALAPDRDNALRAAALAAAASADPNIQRMAPVLAGMARQEAPNLATASPGSTIYDPRTGRVIATLPDRPQERERQFARLRELADRDPDSLTPGERAELHALRGALGGPPVMGTPPPGYEVRVTPDGRVTMAAIPGSPAEREERERRERELERARNERQTADVVLQDIDRIEQIIRTSVLPTVGLGAGTVASIPGTGAADIARLLDTIRANIGFAQLNRMRAESPTGGALGQVTERELMFLQAVMGSLDQSQSPDQFRRNLGRLRDAFRRVIDVGMSDAEIERELRALRGLPSPPAPMPGPGGVGTAEPPARPGGATQRLRYNPATGALEPVP